jgi:hypothetical protein
VAARRRSPRRSRATGGEEEEPTGGSVRGIRKLLETPSDADAEAWARMRIRPPFAHLRPGGAGDSLRQPTQHSVEG